MRLPRLPDWLLYLAVVALLACVALFGQEHADAPPAPPPLPPTAARVLGPASPFDPAVVVDAPTAAPHAGTAFSVGASGLWVTARHVIEGCGRIAIVVAPGRGVIATVKPGSRGETMVLTTRGGVAALPLFGGVRLERGMRAFHPGFPGDQAGEVASRLVGRENLVVKGRGGRSEPVLVWAQVGRTQGQRGSLAGLSGAPALDAAGRVIGVTIAASPRRGRLYTTTPEGLRSALAARGVQDVSEPTGEVVSADNYGRIADDLRRDTRVAQVVCLGG